MIKNKPLCAVHSLPFASIFLAVSMWMPVSAYAANNDALLPDMNATTSLKAPVPLRTLNMKSAVKRAVAWHPIVTGARERTN